MGRTMGVLGMNANTQTRVLLGAITLAVLAGCSEREVILPGKREPVTAAVSAETPAAEAEADALANAARDISLPPQEANANAAQSFGTPAFRTDHPQLNQTLTPIWSVNIGEGDSRKHRIVADPVVSDGRVFTLDAETTVSAVSTSGQLLWQRWSWRHSWWWARGRCGNPRRRSLATPKGSTCCSSPRCGSVSASTACALC